MNGLLENVSLLGPQTDVNLNLEMRLESPDLDLLRQQRMQRNRDTMRHVDPHLTNTIIPPTINVNTSLQEQAATKIQAAYRGRLGRKNYVQMLYDQFAKDEAMRMEKTLSQVEEGEMLVENHLLQVQFEDDCTTRRNKSRRYATHVVTIQRAWRDYLKRRRREPCAEDDLSSDDASSGIVALSSPEDDLASSHQPPPAMTTVVSHDVTQLPKETDSDFAKRVRKINYLSLAHEFAALQECESRDEPESPMSEGSMVDSGTGSSPLDSSSAPFSSSQDCNLNMCSNSSKQRSLDNRRDEKCDMFDVYNIESTLPQVDWNTLEEQLHRSAEEQKRMSRRNEREEIRRRLAMTCADEDYYGGERALRKPSLQARLQSGMNLQICYVNEAPTEDASAATAATTTTTLEHPAACSRQAALTTTRPSATKKTLQSQSLSADCLLNTNDSKDFFMTQAQLQAEARLALAQARPMAHMQLEVERQLRKKSPIAEIVGIPGIGDGKRRHIRPQLMHQMNLAQIQVVVNDLHAQIESLNEELVLLLVERDDLHMEQDSMLVDIEDFTRRAEEVSTKKPKKKDKRK